MSLIKTMEYLLVIVAFGVSYGWESHSWHHRTAMTCQTKSFLMSSSDDDSSSSKSIERRQRKDQEKKRMPLSQSWYKTKQINLSKNQKRLMNDLFPVHGIVLHYGEPLSLEKMFPAIQPFNENNKITLDIGFGMGDSIVGMALNHREELNHFYIGCEIHKAGIASVLGQIQEHELTSIKLIRADISMLLEHHLVQQCLDEVCIYFPDPWPNTERDGERRVVRNQIIDLLSKKLKPHGKLRIATDVMDYAQHVKTVMAMFPQFRLNFESNHPPCQDGPTWRPITKYERRAVELGNMIWDFEYELLPSVNSLL